MMQRKTGWRSYTNQCVAQEISSLSRFCNRVVQLFPTPADRGILLEAIVAPQKQHCDTLTDCPVSMAEEITLYLLNGNLNHSFDIHSLLVDLHDHMKRQDRACIVLYNPYLKWIYHLANRLGFRQGPIPETFITKTTLQHILHLAHFRAVRTRTVVYSPFQLAGLGDILNRAFSILPGFRWLGLTYVVICQAIPKISETPSLSIIVPTRNEAGTIASIIPRLPSLPCPIEIIFVEGHSRDNTWQAIQDVMKAYQGPIQLKAFQQTGKGKNDAVRLGFSKASGQLLTILDADLTMPPEQLKQFYDAYASGKADFVNGARFVYPIEKQATPWLNYHVNRAFAKLLSWVLDMPIGDALCGTKLLRKADYHRLEAWRHWFGDKDPFGDFDLLFSAAQLGLGTVDIPIRYQARTYGTTNIAYFQNGWILLKMIWFGFFKIKLGFAR